MMRKLIALLVVGVVAILIIPYGMSVKSIEWSKNLGSSVISVATNTNGESIIVACEDGKVYVMDISGKMLYTHNIGTTINDIDIYGNNYCIADDDGNLYYYEDGKLKWMYKGISSLILCKISEKKIVVASDNGTVLVFNSTSSVPSSSFNVSGTPMTASLSPDGSLVACGDIFGNLYVYSCDEKKILWNFLMDSTVWTSQFSEDNVYLCVGTDDGFLYLFQQSNPNPLRKWELGGRVSCASITKNGGKIAAGTSDTIFLFSKDSAVPLWKYSWDGTNFIYISSNGKYLTAGSYAGSIIYMNTSPTVIWEYECQAFINDMVADKTTSCIYIGVDSGELIKLNSSRENKPPMLSAGGVSPNSGTPNTIFNYTIIYTDEDNDAPEYVYVYIDDDVKAMRKLNDDDADYTDGCIYVFSTSLNIGKHKFKFKCSDGNQEVVLPSEGFFEGPLVHREGENDPPYLKDGKVTPSEGLVGTEFTYKVIYTDANGDEPIYVKVFIDGKGYSMNKESGDAKTGIIYVFKTHLSVGNHTFYFECSDGKNKTQYPEKFLVGPVVKESGTNLPPKLYNASLTPSSGNSSTVFRFSVYYKDPDGDPPIEMYVYIDDLARNMSFSSGDFINGANYVRELSLSEGNHTYYFIVKSANHTVRLPSFGRFSGPYVEKLPLPPLIPKISASKTEIYEGEEIELDASESEGEIVTYLFIFDDGSNSTWVSSEKIKHTYKNSGDYTVKLYVKDKYGRISESYAVVSIKVIEKEEKMHPYASAIFIFIILFGSGVFVYLAITKMLGTPPPRRGKI